jgi:hypothetical protein
MSFAQQRLWFLQQLYGGRTYNNTLLLRARPGLDPATVIGAIERLAARHEMLRAIFWLGEKGPVQGVLPPNSPPFIQVQRVGARPDADEQIRKAAAACAAWEFILSREPGFRATLIESRGGELLAVVLVAHHIIWDAESKSIAVRELNLACDPAAQDGARAAASPGRRVSYLQFARRQRADHASGQLAGSLAYWSRQLAGLAPSGAADEAGQAGQPTGPDFAGHSIPLRIDGRMTTLIQRRAGLERSTVFIVLATAWFALLHAMHGATDLATGIDISDRDDPRTSGTIGLFVNQVAVRADLSGDPALPELSHRVRHACLAAYEHKDAPFDLVVRELKADRSLGRDPVFQTKIYYVEGPSAPGDQAMLTEMEIEPPVARHELSLGLTRRNGEITGYLNYRNSAYRHSSCQAAARAYEQIVTLIATQPGLRLGDLTAAAGRLQHLARKAG